MTACTCPDCGHEFDATPIDGHRLLCGDATRSDDVACLGDHGHLMVTDPPYGVEYDPNWRNDGSLDAWKASRSLGGVEQDDVVDWSPAWRLFLGNVAYVWTASGGSHLLDSGAGLMREGFELRNLIVWAKQHFVIGRGNYHYQHEGCWYAVRKGRKSHWRGARDQSTVWEAKNASAFGGGTDGEEKTPHSTQKPVEVMRRPMLNNSNAGDLVYDPFLGSGTTIVAAETTGRRCRAIELEPAYVDVSVLRWQAFSGKAAVLNGGGTFEEVAAARAAQAAA